MDHATVSVGPMGHATVIHNGCVVVSGHHAHHVAGYSRCEN
jgi:hypothetical protein